MKILYDHIHHSKSNSSDDSRNSYSGGPMNDDNNTSRGSLSDDENNDNDNTSILRYFRSKNDNDNDNDNDKNLIESDYINEENEFKKLIQSLNLRIHYIKSDGNCLFRAIADQVYGNENFHSELRFKIVNYIKQNESYFTSFIEENKTFGSYIDNMSHDCIYGGYLELYAASKLLKIEIKVYQVNGPTLVLSCDNDASSVAIAHISYHGECHYNSLRMISDILANKPAICFHARTNGYTDDQNVNLVISAVPWLSNEHAEVALQQSYNSVESAIELLIRDEYSISRLIENDDDHYIDAKPNHLSPLSIITAPFEILISSIGAVCAINNNKNSNVNNNGFTEENNFTSFGNILTLTPRKSKIGKRVRFNSTPPIIHTYSVDEVDHNLKQISI